MTMTPAARGTRAPRGGRQPTAAFSRANRGLSEPFDPANYPFKAFPKDCPFQPEDAVQIADEDTGEVFVGRVVDKAVMMGNALRVGVLFEDSPNMRMVPVEALTARLTDDEQATLKQHEQIIERGIKVFFEVGDALMVIRDNRLYRATHATFEAYCQERWNISRPRAYQLMEAARIIENLSTNGRQALPTNERQARALKAVLPEYRSLVWEVAVATSDGNPTAVHIKSTGEVTNNVIQTGALDDGTGQDIPLKAATVDHLKAAITEETYERMKRQQQHIAEAQQRKQAALAAKAKVGELLLQVTERDDMGYVRIVDTHTGAVLCTMALVHEDRDGNEYEFEPGLDMELARQFVKLFNGRVQS